MTPTVLLAQIWGPIILAIGVGIFVSRNYYAKIYRDLEKDTLAVLVFGIFAMIVGIIQVSAHHTWGSLAEIVVTILGLGLLVKGTLFIVLPRLIDKAGNYWANKKLIPISGFLSLIVGIYLTWFSYFS